MTMTLIDIQTASNAAGSTSSSFTLTPPATASPGDLMVAVAYKGPDGTHTFSPARPTGFTASASYGAVPTTNLYLAIAHKVLVAADKTTGVTWGVSSAGVCGMALLTFRTPREGEVTAMTHNSANFGAQTSVTTPLAASGTVIRATMVAVVAIRTSGTTEPTFTWTSPAGTKVADWGLDGGATTRKASIFVADESAWGGASFSADASWTAGFGTTEGIAITVLYKEKDWAAPLNPNQAIHRASRW